MTGLTYRYNYNTYYAPPCHDVYHYCSHQHEIIVIEIKSLFEVRFFASFSNQNTFFTYYKYKKGKSVTHYAKYKCPTIKTIVRSK